MEPTTELHAAWLAAHREWGGDHQSGSGLRNGDDVTSGAGFAAWVARLRRDGDQSLPPPAGLVHAAYWWITDRDDTVLGAISLRYGLTPFMREAVGHIGYGVRPSARGRGVASWALGEVLPVARERGIDPVLVTCDEDNAASARVIEKLGGVLEDVRDTSIGRKRRYWISG